MTEAVSRCNRVAAPAGYSIEMEYTRHRSGRVECGWTIYDQCAGEFHSGATLEAAVTAYQAARGAPVDLAALSVELEGVQS